MSWNMEKRKKLNSLEKKVQRKIRAAVWTGGLLHHHHLRLRFHRQKQKDGISQPKKRKLGNFLIFFQETWWSTQFYNSYHLVRTNKKTLLQGSTPVRMTTREYHRSLTRVCVARSHLDLAPPTVDLFTHLHSRTEACRLGKLWRNEDHQIMNNEQTKNTVNVENAQTSRSQWGTGLDNG